MIFNKQKVFILIILRNIIIKYNMYKKTSNKINIFLVFFGLYFFGCSATTQQQCYFIIPQSTTEEEQKRTLFDAGTCLLRCDVACLIMATVGTVLSTKTLQPSSSLIMPYKQTSISYMSTVLIYLFQLSTLLRDFSQKQPKHNPACLHGYSLPRIAIHKSKRQHFGHTERRQKYCFLVK